MDVTTKKQLQAIACKVRMGVVEGTYHAKSCHPGGSLSISDLLTYLYFAKMHVDPTNPELPDRDRLVLSKGHCAPALYAVLAQRGFFPAEELQHLRHIGAMLQGHPCIHTPGIDLSSGSLGQGISAACGMALAAKMDKRNYKTFVMMGDGEQGEGSIYEAAMAGHQYKLDNLVAIIDRNHLQISGNTEDVMAIEDIAARWTAFGWDVKRMDGDDMEDIMKTFAAIDYTNHKPHLLISNTTKGKGVSYMENVAKWHHGMPSEEQYRQALSEIDERIKNL